MDNKAYETIIKLLLEKIEASETDIAVLNYTLDTTKQKLAAAERIIDEMAAKEGKFPCELSAPAE